MRVRHTLVQVLTLSCRTFSVWDLGQATPFPCASVSSSVKGGWKFYLPPRFIRRSKWDSGWRPWQCLTQMAKDAHTSGRYAAGNVFWNVCKQILWHDSDPLGPNQLKTEKQNPTLLQIISSKQHEKEGPLSTVPNTSWKNKPADNPKGRSSPSPGPLLQPRQVSSPTLPITTAHTPSHCCLWGPTGSVAHSQTTGERAHSAPPLSWYKLLRHKASLF